MNWDIRQKHIQYLKSYIKIKDKNYASEWSLTSPRRNRPMKGLSTWWRSISAKEVSLPAFIVVSLDTSGHTVLKSDISSLRLGKQSKRQVSLALNLPSLIMLFGNNDIILKGVLSHAVYVVNMVTPRPNASEWSLTSPRRNRPMKGLSTWWRVS
jgi:hypothetical protein